MYNKWYKSEWYAQIKIRKQGIVKMLLLSTKIKQWPRNTWTVLIKSYNSSNICKKEIGCKGNFVKYYGVKLRLMHEKGEGGYQQMENDYMYTILASSNS